MPSRGIACLPIAPSRHGISVRVFALASLSPSAHSHRSASPRGSELCYRVAIPLLSRPCIALCSTDHCRLLCQTLHIVADCQDHLIVTHQGLAVAPTELFKSMPCPLLNQSVPSTRATLPRSPVQSLRISGLFSHFARAVRVSAVRPPAPTAQDFAVLFLAPAVRIVAVPIRAVPSRCSAAHGCAVHPPFISTQFNAASGPTISMLCRRPC